MEGKKKSQKRLYWVLHVCLVLEKVDFGFDRFPLICVGIHLACGPQLPDNMEKCFNRPFGNSEFVWVSHARTLAIKCFPNLLYPLKRNTERKNDFPLNLKSCLMITSFTFSIDKPLVGLDFPLNVHFWIFMICN
jgi:hypothetical protein